MSEIVDLLDDNLRYQKYIPERNYVAQDWKAFKAPFPDLCENCDSYYDLIHAHKLTQTSFPPTCNRHILDKFKDLVATDFATQEDYDELLVNADPVAWAYKNFGWEAHWYQEEIMSCTSRKKVVRAGRRSGKTVAIVMLVLWGMFTHENWSVLVIAPYQAQVTKIFDEMEKLLMMNPELMQSIKRKTKNPQRLELHNGSKALGFSSGAKSASKSDKIRGQDANYIVLDEADYLADDDLEAILAILASHPDCGLWASSTPSGRHAKFYQWCVSKDLGFKEFHFISQESPRWTPDAEYFFRSNFDSITFEHEFLAEFGLSEGGVFRNDLIDDSLRPYELPQPRSSSQSRIVMGVDWNGQKNGVHIIITEYWNGKYRVLDKQIVRADQFTQHASVDKILELDRQYSCDYIYVDEGYGMVQVEMLHKIGMQNPGTGLQRRVVPYAFNKPIEIRDPRTGVMVRKPSKPFLVNIVAMQLQNGRLELPMSEDTQILVNSKDNEGGGKSPGFVQQMRNFSVERISVLGLPTYSAGDDHTLFAFMLSIAGFLLQYSDLRQMNHAVNGGYIAAGTTLGPATPGDEQKNQKMSEVVRQIDAGGKSRLGTDMYSVFQSKQNSESIKRSIAKGDRKTIQRYFGNSNIKRGSFRQGPENTRNNL